MVRTCTSAEEYAHAIGPHEGHDTYRCDDVPGRRMGQGCRTCGFEAYVRIEDFKRTGDLSAFDRVMEGYRARPRTSS